MKLLTTLASSLVLLSLSTSTFAEQQSPHSVGVQFGVGGLEYKNNDTDNDAFASSYLYYNYKFLPNYYVEVGLLGGSDIEWDCDKTAEDWDCFSDNDKNNTFDLEADELELSALVIALKTDLSLSKRNKLYAKIGASYYDYEIILDKTKFADESGVGLVLEGGWEYRWDQGLGINVGLQYQKMGDLDINTLNAGVSYSF